MDRSRSTGSGAQEGGVRWVAGLLVAALHVLAAIGLIRAFTPDLAQTVSHAVLQAFTVTPSPPPPPPPVTPEQEDLPANGRAGAAGRRAVPRPVAVPSASITIKPTQAPPLAGEGKQNAAGASAGGVGTGAAQTGTGPGSGSGGAGTGSGEGAGGGRAASTVKIAGEINSAKDYPRASRDLRIDASVTIDISVDAQGRASACRVVQASPDPAADQVTCQLALRRFRFRPALDGSGRPAPSVYRWRQRWFY